MDNPTSINEALWSQFGAALDMLENAILLCPGEYWDNDQDYWYKAYHCAFWTDYYLTTEPEKFHPPAPFDLSEFEPTGIKPKRVYTKSEMLGYLTHCRKKSIQLISGLSLEQLNDRWINEYKNFSVLEILIYNIRHIQHHSAQLNLLLRQTFDKAPNWVSRVEKE